jgi:glucosamine--fructose-6-phosphate aminotransferase (isomerizing)
VRSHKNDIQRRVKRLRKTIRYHNHKNKSFYKQCRRGYKSFRGFERPEMYEEEQAPLTLSEIYHQSDSCRQTTARARDRQRVFQQFLPLENYSDIIITGCGSSHHLAMCASFAWSEMLARPVIAVASSELAHFAEHYLALGAKPLVIAISRSGGTTEVKLAVERLRREYGARSLAIISDRGDVGYACDAEIVFTECRERSVVMTQAFTCMLAGLYLLADGAIGSTRAREITQLPRLIDDAISLTESLRSLIEDPAINRFFFLGSGAMKGLADECALKMTEMALETAFSHRTLEFRHGPIATLNSTDQVVIFPTAAERQYLDTLLGEITTTGSQVVVIDSQPCRYADSRVTSLVILQSTVLGAQFEVFRPALFAHVGQLFAYWRAAIRDLNPDAPRHLARTVLLDV